MEAVPLEGTYRGPMTIDVCTACRGFWFDAGEQFRLTPAATLLLVRRVEASRDQPRQRVGTRLPCPRCTLTLGVTYDIIHDDKYRYFRCPDHHGLFMPFFEFLRSQGLVRGLTPQEVDALKQKLMSITCSSCGAPIDLRRMRSSPTGVRIRRPAGGWRQVSMTIAWRPRSICSTSERLCCRVCWAGSR